MSYDKLDGTQIDICRVGLEEATNQYFKRYGVNPTCLIVGKEDLAYAYRVVAHETMQHLMVIAVPDLPLDSWMICGSKGLIYSEGA